MTTLGLICRFQPVHLIHARLLRPASLRAERLKVGIGSPERSDARNPFTLAERLRMLERVCAELPSEVELIPVPDLGHGPRWAAQVARLFGPLDRFVSANGYVRRLLEPTYRLTHPLELIRPSERAPIGGAEVRYAMASGQAWQGLVPAAVAELLEREGWIDRFLSEHGLAVLQDHAGARCAQREESTHVRMG